MPAGRSPEARLTLYTTMATWCPSCRRELPHLARLRALFGTDQLAMYGVPVDPKDSAEDLAQYTREHRPAYELLRDLTSTQLQELRANLERYPRVVGLPASVICDTQGRVIHRMGGAPSVSKLRELLSDS